MLSNGHLTRCTIQGCTCIASAPPKSTVDCEPMCKTHHKEANE